jgi:serine/threonine protein kinase
MLTIQQNSEPIPGYRLIERLGRGGCGEVWKAEAPGGIQKAIKFVLGDTSAISHDGSAAEQERKSLHRVKSIRHPFILSIERFEVIEGQLIIVMELADRNLQDRFNECVGQNLPGIPRDELLRFLEEAAEALDLMNTHHQIQHLDVKPQNIFLVSQHVKVGDFGLAKDLEGQRAALTGGMTPMYAPPETFDGWVSRQSDQYSLAIVYQEMLTGRRPFSGSNTRQLIMQHLTAPPDLSSLPVGDRGPMAKALAKVPADRFPSCAAFIRALRSPDGARPFPSSSALLARPNLNVEAKTDPIVRTAASAAVPVASPPEPAPVKPPAVPTPSSNSSGTHWPIPRHGDPILFPAIFVGVGGSGLAVLRQMKRLIHDRFGQSTLPHFRWLYIDADPRGREAALEGPKSTALNPAETLLVPPQPPAHYQNRTDLASIDARLTSESLGRLPAEPSTHGIRGLGRLAIGDHLVAARDRIKAALETFTRRDPLNEADQMLRLGTRSTSPRVYIAASIGGGAGSGMAIDLAYLARRELLNLGLNPEHVVGLLSLPDIASNDGDSSAAVNARAFLEELRHHDRADTTYELKVGDDSTPTTDNGRPFRRCTFFRSKGAHAQAAHCLFAETLTQVGRILHPDQPSRPAQPYSTVGVRRVFWPRNRLLRGLARRLARETLSSWIGPAVTGLPDEIKKAVGRLWHDRRLELSVLRLGIEYGAAQKLGTPIETLVEEVTHPVSGGGKDGPPLTAADAVLKKMVELMGDASEEAPPRPARIADAFSERADELATAAEAQLSPLIAMLLERPGQRVAAAREALQLLSTKLTGDLETVEREAAELLTSVRAEFARASEMLDVLPQGGKSVHRKATVSAEFPACVAKWAKARYELLRDRAAIKLYRRLLAAIPEYESEIDAVVSRLAALAREPNPDGQAGLPADGVCEYLFPYGAASTDEAVDRLASAFGDAACREFDDLIQGRLRAAGKGIVQVAFKPEWGPKLVNLVQSEAERFVEGKANRMSISQALLKHFSKRIELLNYLNGLVESAASAPPDRSGTSECMVVGLPGDSSGQQIAGLIRRLSNDCPSTTVVTEDELILVRECRGVSLTTLLDEPESPVEKPAPTPVPAVREGAELAYA